MESNKRNSFFPTTSVRAVDDKNFRITHVINTKGLDRYDTVVLPKGCQPENYLANPVVLWLHNVDGATMQLPIAKCVELSIGEDEIEAITEFNPNDPLAMKVFQAYKDGFMRAWSIGFMPKSWVEVTPLNLAEVKTKYNLPALNLTQEDFEKKPYGVYVITEWELYEYSAVPVPGNPECLSDEDAEKFTRELVSRGLMGEAEARRINFRELDAKKRSEETAECKCEDKTSCKCKTAETTEAVVEEPKAAEVPASTEKVEETQAAAEVKPEAVVEAPVAEAAAEAKTEAETTVSTAENQEKTETVAETDEVETLRAEVVSLRGNVEGLTQENLKLSERVAKLETELAANVETSNEVKTLRAEMDAVRRTVEVDNIEATRKVAQKTTGNGNTGTFFSDFLGRRA